MYMNWIPMIDVVLVCYDWSPRINHSTVNKICRRTVQYSLLNPSLQYNYFPFFIHIYGTLQKDGQNKKSYHSWQGWQMMNSTTSCFLWWVNIERGSVYAVKGIKVQFLDIKFMVTKEKKVLLYYDIFVENSDRPWEVFSTMLLDEFMSFQKDS